MWNESVACPKQSNASLNLFYFSVQLKHMRSSIDEMFSLFLWVFLLCRLSIATFKFQDAVFSVQSFNLFFGTILITLIMLFVVLLFSLKMIKITDSCAMRPPDLIKTMSKFKCNISFWLNVLFFFESWINDRLELPLSRF